MKLPGGYAGQWLKPFLLGIFPMGWLVFFFLFPLLLIGALSFAEKDDLLSVSYTWTLENYRTALEPIYLVIFAKSFWYAGLTTLLCFLLGFPIAILLVFAPSSYKPLLLLGIMFPFWTNLLIRSFAMIAVLRTQGYLNDLLEVGWGSMGWMLSLVGFVLPEFSRPILLYNNFAVLFGLVYTHLPFMILPLYAALERMDKKLLESSFTLGANQWKTFWYITLPLAKHGIFAGIILCFVPAIGSFLIPDLLGGTDSQMISNVIERQFKSANDWPLGATFSMLLVYLTFGILALYTLKGKKDAW